MTGDLASSPIEMSHLVQIGARERSLLIEYRTMLKAVTFGLVSHA
jgi:hypothetical protein